MKKNLLNSVKKLICLCCMIGMLFPVILRAQEIPQQYREDWSVSWPNRKAQHLEIKAYIDKLLDEDINKAMTCFQPDFFSPESYKNSLYPYRKIVGDFYGYPPPKAMEGKITKFIKVGEDVNCTVYRVWVEVIEGVNAYGIYMVPKKLTGKAPLIIAQHGGGGNPEAICDIGTRENYHSFGQEAVKRGYCVWAPALAMNSSYAKDPDIPGANRELLDKKLKFAGTSIIGVEIQKIIESTKALAKERPEIDATRIGMTGLSWGGFFTMYTTALCPFIKVACPASYIQDSETELKKAVADNSKIPPDRMIFNGVGHFQALGLICPRPCMVQLGSKDGLFNMDEAKKETDRAAELYKKLGVSNRFEFNVHPGGHEFEINAIFKFFGKYL
jgi:dienelactone hydrolase